MIEVIYFSASGHCKTIADFCALTLKTKAADICCDNHVNDAQKILLVFPVYCQNIPFEVKEFIKKSKAEYAAMIAVYGGISYGRVLYDAQKIFKGKIIAASYFPSGHSYLNDASVGDLQTLVPLINKLQSDTSEVKIPKTSKNLFADFAPALRSRIGVKIIRSDACDKCNVCKDICPRTAIREGIPDNKCMRCLKCVHNCPKKALTFSLSPVMQRYLTSYRKNETELFL